MCDTLPKVLQGLPGTYSANTRTAIKEHVLDLVQVYNGLLPRCSVPKQTSHLGNSPTFMLEGTIPVEHNSVTYHIPIQIWVGPQYPRGYPLVYVVAMQNMYISPGHRHVDRNGRCFTHYLTDWSQKPAGKNLVDLVIDLVTIFSKESPLYERRDVIQAYALAPVIAENKAAPQKVSFTPSQQQPKQQSFLPTQTAQPHSIPSLHSFEPVKKTSTTTSPASSLIKEGAVDFVDDFPSKPKQKKELFDDSSDEEDEKAAAQEMQCCVCWTNRKDCCFLPCAHVCTCSKCSALVSDCPQCRRPIEQKLKVFI